MSVSVSYWKNNWYELSLYDIIYASDLRLLPIDYI